MNRLFDSIHRMLAVIGSHLTRPKTVVVTDREINRAILGEDPGHATP